MKRFKEFQQKQEYFMELAGQIACLQEEMAPELWSVLADDFLQEVKQVDKLFELENNSKHEQGVAKYRGKLKRKGWRKRVRNEIALMKKEEKQENEELKKIKKNLNLAQSQKDALLPDSNNNTKLLDFKK